MALICSSCAARAPVAAESPDRRVMAPRTQPAPSRALHGHAIFDDLVAGIAADELREITPEHCLIAKEGTGFRVAADLAVAVHPIPTPPDDVDGAFESGHNPRVLSRWGQHGAGTGAITLVALTETPPPRHAWVLMLTDRGFYLRPTDDVQTVHISAEPDTALAEHLREAGADATDVTLFVSAEKEVPVARIVGVLEMLSTHPGAVALAVPLAHDTALPAPPTKSAVALRCPDGLPENQELEGDMAVPALTEALAPLRTRATVCLESADTRGAAGGRLTLGLRIGADGVLKHACMIADETADDSLAACVLAAARDLRFPVPNPAGTVDVELPLLLRPNSAPAQAPVCGATQPAQAAAN